MNQLASKDVKFFPGSLVDEAGRVFFHDGRVFRAVYSGESSSFFRQLLKSPWIGEAFDAGLVKTWIPSDVSLEGAKLVLEHQFVPFLLHPAECTAYMHWLSAKAMVRVNRLLSRHGLVLKDSHPWNLMFYKGNPFFVDFGSLQEADSLWQAWLDEFRRYYAVPIWLASKGKKELAQEYRRQHITGFGLRLFDYPPLYKMLFRSLIKNQRFFGEPSVFFEKIDAWLDNNKPEAPRQERWASYPQYDASNDPLKPAIPKQQFVFDVLSAVRPSKVLDCAANKGYYSEMASLLGASVVAFDYEEFCVDECLMLAQKKDLDITPAIMDFRQPTPPFALGLTYGASYERFRSDIVLALGLCHHLCIAQALPVQLFCQICMEYSTKGIVLEYVDPSDVHVSGWGKPVPPDYSLESFEVYFSKKYPYHKYSQRVTEDGVNRIMAYYYM